MRPRACLHAAHLAHQVLRCSTLICVVSFVSLSQLGQRGLLFDLVNFYAETLGGFVPPFSILLHKLKSNVTRMHEIYTVGFLMNIDNLPLLI